MLNILKSPQIQLPRNDIVIITLDEHIFSYLSVCTPTNTESKREGEREREREKCFYKMETIL